MGIHRPGLLERALANLIDNAHRHGGPDVEITVSGTGDDPPRCVIRVVDHGPGLPTTDREQVFAAFHQGGDTAGASSGGGGWGLSVANGFITRSEENCRPPTHPGAVPRWL